ncbi:MAG: radical SAM protein [Candidatus Omnitrophota bacterium]
MKKVALINPGKNQRYAIQEPLNLGFIASYLQKHSIDVRIIDELAGQNVKNEIESYSPDIVGITATTPLIPDAYRIADKCRQMGILTVMGGVHVSVLPQEALTHADIVVQGEGERAMFDIIRENIKSGVITRPYIEDLNEVPFSARELMQMDFYLHTKDRLPDSYLYFVPLKTKAAALLTSRGCPYSCIFCHNLWKNMPYRCNCPERVISEIKHLVAGYDVRYFFFIEDNLFVNKKRLKSICDLIKSEKIDIAWGGNARVDNIDLDILNAAKDAGCKQITFGFESGSQRILDILDKRTTVEQNRRAIELCNQAGIIPQGTFMIGNPTETMEDIKETQAFIQSNDIESVGISISTPFPGTKLWDMCKDNNQIPQTLEWADFTYDRIPMQVCGNISKEELRRIKADMESITFFKRNKAMSVKEILVKCILHPIRAVNIIRRAIKDKLLLSLITRKGQP